MIWTKLAAGLLAAGVMGGAGMAQAGPLYPATPALSAVASVPVETVQYYYYDDYYDDYAPPPRYRVYREPPPYYRPYAPPSRYYGPPPRRHVERQKEAIKDYRRAQKEMFKERVRAWNRTHGF